MDLSSQAPQKQRLGDRGLLSSLRLLADLVFDQAEVTDEGEVIISPELTNSQPLEFSPGDSEGDVRVAIAQGREVVGRLFLWIRHHLDLAWASYHGSHSQSGLRQDLDYYISFISSVNYLPRAITNGLYYRIGNLELAPLMQALEKLQEKEGNGKAAQDFQSWREVVHFIVTYNILAYVYGKHLPQEHQLPNLCSLQIPDFNNLDNYLFDAAHRVQLFKPSFKAMIVMKLGARKKSCST